MDSRSVAIPPPPLVEARDGQQAVQRRFARLVRASVRRGPYPAGVTLKPCSRWPILAFTMPIPVFMNADPGVHDAPIRLFTMLRSARSRSAEIRTKGIQVGAHDLLIAATAIAAGYGVATRDERSFPRIPGLTTAIW